jgi:uncharacterized protein YegL
MARICNGLEDGRIETLFSRRYPKARDYFETTFLNIIWRQRKQASPLMFLACRARRLIIDAKYPAFFETLFSQEYGEEVTEKVKKLIDQYLTTTKSEELYNIADEIRKLINNDSAINNDPNLTERGNLARKKTSDKETEELAQEIKEELEDDTEQEPNQDTKNKQAKIREKGQEIVKQNQELKEETNKFDKLRKEYNKKSDEFKEKVRQKNSETDEEKRKALEKEADDIYKERQKIYDKYTDQDIKLSNKARNRKTLDLSEIIDTDIEEGIKQNIQILSEEISRDLDTIAGIKKKDIEVESDPSGVTNETRVLAKDIKKIFSALKNENKRGKVVGQNVGTININKAMSYRQTGNFRIFDKTISDYHRKQRLGVIILIDASGSMRGTAIQMVTQGAWAVKEGLKNSDNKIAVIAYSISHKLIKGFNDEGNFSSIEAYGETDPSSALKLANNMIKSEPKIPNWLVIIMTDGDWTETKKSHEEIKILNKARADTVLVSTMKGDNKHECKHLYHVHATNELREIFTKLVNKTRRNINENIKTNSGVI